MKKIIHSSWSQAARILRRVDPAVLLTAGWLSSGAVFEAGAQPVSIALKPNPSGLPGDLLMTWNSVANSTYLIQTATNLADPNPWETFDAVTAPNNSVSYNISPGASINGEDFRTYRLALPQPQITGVQPAFVNSSNGAGLLYLAGQMLPSNATVVIDGQDFTPTIINSNGVWASVNLASLAPGTTVTGSISIIDNALGTVAATFVVQSPVTYGTSPSNEQLQGPPEVPLQAKPVPRYNRRKMTGSVFTRGAGGPSDIVIAGDSNHDLMEMDGFVVVPDRANERNSFLEVKKSTGELQEMDIDLSVAGRGLDFEWIRTYRSRTGPTTAQGASWDFSYDVTLAVQSDGTVALSTGDGRTETFYPNGTNSWVRDEYFVQVGDLNGDGYPDVLFPDNSKWLFTPSGPAAGKLASIVDRNGNTMTLNYDVSGRLDSVVDTFGRTNTVAYNNNGMIASVTDFSGRVVSYAYDTNNNLIQSVSPAVTGTPTGNDFAGGKTNNYSYSSGFADDRLNHNLEIVSHEMGHNWEFFYQTNTDPASLDFDAVASVTYGPYTEQLTRYAQTPSPANGFAVVEAISCDAVGNVSETYYDSRQRCVQKLDYTGRSNPALPVTQTSNRPTGQLRSTDPEYFETVWTWNLDSLCSSVTENPQSLPRRQIFLHERDLSSSASALQKGDLRVIDDFPSSAVSTTGNGTSDTAERSWHFDYDPRFGSPDDFGDSIQEKIMLHHQGLCVPSGLGQNSFPLAFSSFTRQVYMPVTPAIIATGNHNPLNGPAYLNLCTATAPSGHTGNMVGNHKDCMMAVCLDAHTRRFVPNDDGVAASTGGHTGNMVGNHKDCMMAVCLDAHTRRFVPNDDGVAASTGGHTGNMVGNHKDCMMAVCLDAHTRRFVPNDDGVAASTGGHTGNMVGNHKDCMCNFVNGRYLLKAGIALAGFGALDTDENGGLDRMTTIFGDGTGRVNRVRMAIGDMNRDGEPDFCVSATDPDGNVTTASYDGQGNRLSAAAPLGDQVYFAYNACGQLTGMTNPPDGKGYSCVDTFLWFTNGTQNGYLQSATEDANGFALTTTCQYDARGNVTRAVDPKGNDYLYTYNAMDQLVQEQTPTNITARCTNDFIYDANDNLVQATTDLLDNHDTPEHTVAESYAYDSLNRRIAVTNQISVDYFVTTGLGYDGNGNVTAVYSPLAMSGADPDSYILLQYDERDLPFTEADAPLNAADALTNQWNYDVNGNCTEVTSIGATSSQGQTETLTMGYDGFDRCASVTDAIGDTATAAYDRCDNLVVERSYQPAGAAGNQLLAQSTYQYDSLYRSVAVQQAWMNAAGSSEGKGYTQQTFTYAPNNELLTSTDDNQHTARFSYDTAGRCAQITDPRNDMRQFAYDDCDNVTDETLVNVPNSGTSAPSFAMNYTYDSKNRCLSQTDNVGNTSSYAYDSLDRMVQQTDANGNLTGQIYDDLGRCTVSAGDLNGDGILDFAIDAKDTYTWDDNSRCIARTDANTNTTLYSYDSLGRCLTVTNADSTTTVLTYDCFGNVSTSTDPNGTFVTNTYDRLNRQTARATVPSSTVVPSTTFETFAYDGLSRLVGSSDNASTNSFVYDSLDNCQSSTQDGLSVTCSYDGVGNPLSITYPSGRTASYSYDPLDQVASVSEAAAGMSPTTLATYTYAGAGLLGTITRANGTTTQYTWDGQTATANAAGDFGWMEISSVTHTADNGKVIIDQRQFAYDHSQNLISRVQPTPFTTGGPTLTNEFSYDAVNRLTGFSHLAGLSDDYSLQYTLDGDGNRTGATSNSIALPYDMSGTNFEMDRYSYTPYGLHSYDANGNLTEIESTAQALRYKYDYANRLVEVDNVFYGTVIATFGYDALGRRVSKTTYQGGGAGTLPTATTTQYIYGGDMVLEENTNGLLTSDFTMAQQADGSTPDVFVARYNANGVAAYYHSDNLGNVLALTDAQGNVLERTDYNDYGEPTFLSSDGSILTNSTGQPLVESSQGNPFLFGSMFWDGETGLYLINATTSYLDPLEGRCVDSGPGFEDKPWSGYDAGDSIFSGGNGYTFEQNNPWSATQYSGATVTARGANSLNIFFQR